MAFGLRFWSKVLCHSPGFGTYRHALHMTREVAYAPFLTGNPANLRGTSSR